MGKTPQSKRERVGRKDLLDISLYICTLALSMRSILAAVTISATLLGLSGCTKIKARDLIREGNSLYRNSLYSEAIEKYNEAETLEPDGITLYWNTTFVGRVSRTSSGMVMSAGFTNGTSRLFASPWRKAPRSTRLRQPCSKPRLTRPGPMLNAAKPR